MALICNLQKRTQRKTFFFVEYKKLSFQLWLISLKSFNCLRKNKKQKNKLKIYPFKNGRLSLVMNSKE